MAVEGRSHLSLAEARQKCGEKYSCFTQIECTEHMSLSPSYIGRLREGIEEELSKNLMKFCDNLQGVIVAYDKIQLLGRHGSIIEESPFLHFEVKVNYIVFQPQIDSKLIGVVNKFGYDHVGCLVHGCFNASITNPRTQNAQCMDNLKLESSFKFRVVSLESLNGVLLISGAFDDKSLRKSKSKMSFGIDGDKKREESKTEGLSSDVEAPSPRKPKKHKKNNVLQEADESVPKKKKKLSNGDIISREEMSPNNKNNNNTDFDRASTKPEKLNNEASTNSSKKNKKRKK